MALAPSPGSPGQSECAVHPFSNVKMVLLFTYLLQHPHS